MSPLQVDNVVIICDDGLSKQLWQKGIIEEVIKSKDGQVRSALVRSNGKLLRRPASKLAALDIGKSSWSSYLPGGGCHLVTLATQKQEDKEKKNICQSESCAQCRQSLRRLKVIS